APLPRRRGRVGWGLARRPRSEGEARCISPKRLMTDFLAALGLVFVIEGLVFAAFPQAAKRAVAVMTQTPDQGLRLVGLLSAALAFGGVMAGAGVAPRGAHPPDFAPSLPFPACRGLGSGRAHYTLLRDGAEKRTVSR